MSRFLFVHSPLVGPITLERLAKLVGGAVPDLRSFVDADPPLWKAFVDRAVGAAKATEQTVVIGHSGAGAALPLIAHEVQAAATIFVDAVLPPATGIYRTPSRVRQLVDGLASVGGLLHGWSTWWPTDTLKMHVPDAADRIELRSTEPRVPLAFYDETLALPEAWSDEPCAYVRLSPAYDEELEEARRLGWPVAVLDVSHLATMTRPSLVLAAIEDVVDRLRL